MSKNVISNISNTAKKMSKKCPAGQKKFQKNVKKMSRRIKKHFKNIFWTFFVIENGAGGLAVAGGSGGNPFSIPKMSKKCF